MTPARTMKKRGTATPKISATLCPLLVFLFLLELDFGLLKPGLSHGLLSFQLRLLGYLVLDHSHDLFTEGRPGCFVDAAQSTAGRRT